MQNLQQFFKDKKVLITGHTGFKGSWLSRILFHCGADVSGIALKPDTVPNLFDILKIKKDIKNYFCDIRNFKSIKKIIKKERPEIIFHLAAQPLVRDSYDDPLYTFETNILGTANMLQSAKEVSGIKAIVLITTDKVYENKEDGAFYREDDKLGGYDPYSSSKAGAEMIIDSYIKSFFNPKDYGKRHQTLIASARSGNVIGGGDWQKDRIIPDIIRAIFEKNKKINIRNPKSIRPWQYVLDTLYGYMLLARGLYKGRQDLSGAWNFGPNYKNYITVRELVEKTIKKLKRGSYVIEGDPTKHEAGYLKLDNNKAKKILGWNPIFNFDKALGSSLDWYQGFYNREDILKITNQQIKSFFEKV